MACMALWCLLSAIHGTMVSFVYPCSLHINWLKCASFEIRPTRDSWYFANQDKCLSNGDNILNSAVDSSLFYLGGHISRWSGLHYKDLVAQLEDTLEQCRIAQLKPHKKLYQTTWHVIPHFIEKTFVATPSPISAIQTKDQTIRNRVSDSTPPHEHSTVLEQERW